MDLRSAAAVCSPDRPIARLFVLCDTRPLLPSIILQMRNVHRLFCGAILCGLFATISSNGSQATAEVLYPSFPPAVIVSVTGKHYSGITRALSTVGFQVREVSAEGYGSSPDGRPPLLVIPE